MSIPYNIFYIPVNPVDKDGYYSDATKVQHLRYLRVMISSSPSCCGMGELANLSFVGSSKEDAKENGDMERGFQRLLNLWLTSYKLDSDDRENIFKMLELLYPHKAYSPNDYSDLYKEVSHFYDKRNNISNEMNTVMMYAKSRFRKGILVLSYVDDSHATKEFCEWLGLDSVSFKNPNSSRVVSVATLNRDNVNKMPTLSIPSIFMHQGNKIKSKEVIKESVKKEVKKKVITKKPRTTQTSPFWSVI